MSENRRRKEAEAHALLLGESVCPLDRLKKAIDNQEWFEGLILSAIYLEMFGLMILESYYRQWKRGRTERDKIVTKFFGRIGLMKIVQLLYLCDFIELGTYRKMKDIVKERNKWVHRVKPEKKDFAYLVDAEEEDKERIMKFIEDAIECLKRLGVRN